jgi:hypothetical protein
MKPPSLKQNGKILNMEEAVDESSFEHIHWIR